MGLLKWVAGCIVLTAIVWGVLYYGEDVARKAQEVVTGVLSVRGVVEHAASYADKEITVKGQWALGFVWEVVPDKGSWTLRAENAPDNLVSWSYYKFTGVLRIESSVPVLYVTRAEPA